MNNVSQFYTVNDVAQMLGISKSKSYQIIRDLSNQLKKKGYLTVSGKISKNYFNEKIYGGIQDAGIQR